MDYPAIYIATHNAEQYRDLIQDAVSVELEFGLATEQDDVVENYSGEKVVLGSPDLLSVLLATKPPVSWVQSTWAGVTPLVNLAFRDYQLTGVKDVFGAQMGEYVLGYVLAHEIRIAERNAAESQKVWDQSSSSRVEGKTMGIMGTGSIGAHVAAMARQLGIRTLGFNSSGNPVEPFERVYSTESLATFLRQCDYLVGILPDLAATTDLINAEALKTMKNSALLINVGRGNLIDESALCDALGAGEISGAVLDVFKQEPLPEGSPMWTAPNCTVTGHVAAVSHAKDIVQLFLANLERFVKDLPLERVVDFDKGY